MSPQSATIVAIEREPINLNYAGKLGVRRRSDPGVAAFVCGLIFLPSFILVGLGGLHGELNRLGALVWLALGILTTCFVAAAWEQRTWLRARTRWGRAGAVLTAFGWILGFMTIFGPRHDLHSSDTRRQVKCASNLRQIGQALLM